MKVSRFVSRYNSDPEFRARVLEQKRQRRQDPEVAAKEAEARRLRRQRAQEEAEETAERSTRGPARPKFVYINGLRLEMWSSGRTAEFLGIAKSTLFAWERKGKIPENHYTDDLKRRWWPRAFVEWLKPFVDRRLSRELSAREFDAQVERAWWETTTVPKIQE